MCIENLSSDFIKRLYSLKELSVSVSWLPKTFLDYLNHLEAVILNHITLFIAQAEKMDSKSIEFRNFIASEIEFMNIETKFISETIEDISLSHIFYNNLLEKGKDYATTKTQSFFIDKNKFAEDRAIENINRIKLRYNLIA